MSEEAATKKAVVKNMVDMEDGSTENFGSRSQLKSKMNLENKTITFKTITGKVINWVVADVDALSEFQLKVFMYGLLERVKGSLSGVKADKLEEAINEGIADISKGEFVIRSLGSQTTAGLSMIMIAFARAKSQAEADFAHLADIENPEVISEIIALWDSKSAIEKRVARKDARIAYQLSQLEMEANSDKELGSL